MAFVNINGIDKRLVHEQTSKSTGNPFMSVAIPVPQDVSRNGLANIALTPKMVHECKEDASKVNVGIPDDWKLNVSVASYYNSEKKEDTKYKSVEMTPADLLSAHIKQVQAVNEAVAAKTTDAPGMEADGPELD